MATLKSAFEAIMNTVPVDIVVPVVCYVCLLSFPLKAVIENIYANQPCEVAFEGFATTDLLPEGCLAAALSLAACLNSMAHGAGLLLYNSEGQCLSIRPLHSAQGSPCTCDILQLPHDGRGKNGCSLCALVSPYRKAILGLGLVRSKRGSSP